MRVLKQSTAYNLMVFMTDSTDHVTGKTSLTLTITASKDGGAFASISPTVTQRGDGWYNLALTTSHTDTVGDLVIRCTGAGADPTDLVCQVHAKTFADIPSVTDIAEGVWDRLTSALTTAGSIGKLLVDNIDAAISSRLATAGYTTPPTAAAIADQVWDEALADHLGAGSTGAALNAAGAAGDPWSTTLPGAYGAGTAGHIIGNRIDAAISTRASQASVDVVDDFLDTEIAAIKAKTDNLPPDPADASDIAASFVTVNSKLDAIDDYVDTEVAAIKAVTDKLDTAMEVDGPVYRFTTNALEQAPAAPSASTIASAVWTHVTRTITDKTGFELTAGDKTAIANAVEAALLNEGDGQQILQAILNKINADFDPNALAAAEIATAVRTELATELGRIDATISSRATQTDLNDVEAKIDAIDLDIANLDADVDALPLLSEIEASAVLAKQLKLDEIHRIMGLELGIPVTSTPVSRVCAGIDQTIAGDGINTSTISRNP